MNTINHPSARVFYIGYDGNTLHAYGYVDPGNRLDCPAPSFQTFSTEGEYNARLADFGVVTDGLVISDALPIDTLRAVLKGQVNALRAQKLGLPVTYMGHPFDADAEALGNLNGTAAAIGCGIPFPPEFSWRAADNVGVMMTPAQLVGLAARMLQYRTACYVASWTLKAQIEESTAPMTVNIQSLWPDPAATA